MSLFELNFILFFLYFNVFTSDPQKSHICKIYTGPYKPYLMMYLEVVIILYFVNVVAADCFYKFRSCWMPDKFHTLSHLPFCPGNAHCIFCTATLYITSPARYFVPALSAYALIQIFPILPQQHGYYIRHIFQVPPQIRGNSDYNHNIPGWLNCYH